MYKQTDLTTCNLLTKCRTVCVDDWLMTFADRTVLIGFIGSDRGGNLLNGGKRNSRLCSMSTMSFFNNHFPVDIIYYKL